MIRIPQHIFRSTYLEKQFKINVFGVIDVTNAALPHIRERGSGTVVIIGSRSAWITDLPVSTKLENC